MTFRLFTSVMLTAFTLTVPATSPPIRPLEPVNWEADADTRFEPRVEQVVIDMTLRRKPKDEKTSADYWAGWGLSAIEPLRKLLSEAEWQAFSYDAAKLLFDCPLEGAEESLLKELRRSADAATGKKAMTAFRMHMSYAANRSPDLLRPLLQHHLLEVRVCVAERLIYDAQSIPEEVELALETMAASDDILERNAAVRLLSGAPSKKNNARALAIAATVSEEALQRSIAEQQRNAPRERAQEPMKSILEKEAN